MRRDPSAIEVDDGEREQKGEERWNKMKWRMREVERCGGERDGERKREGEECDLKSDR